MVRFVLDPEGRVVPDVAGRLPGRGVWVTADAAAMARAEAKNLFARGFRQALPRVEGLAAWVESLLAKRLIEVISLARKAGHAVTGFEKCRTALISGQAGALIQAADAAPDGAGKLRRLAGGLPHANVLSSGEMGLAFSREFAIHAVLHAGGFADRAIVEARRLAGMRPQPAVAPSEMAGSDPEESDDTREKRAGASSKDD